MFDLKFGSQMRSHLRIIDQTKHSEKVLLFFSLGEESKGFQTTRLCYLFWNKYISLLESPIAENGCPQEELMTNLALLYLNPLSLHLPCIIHPQVALSPCRLLSYVFILRYFCLVLTILPIFSNLGITVVLLQQRYYSIVAVTDKQYRWYFLLSCIWKDTTPTMDQGNNK